MIYELKVSEQADSDLRGIFEYIPDSDKKVVTILRVMYAGRGDTDNQLNLYTKQQGKANATAA